MVKLIIDDIDVEINEGATILEAANSVGIKIPTLCHLKEINEVGACRICLVDVEGCDKLCTSCNTYVTEGMVVHTNNQRIRNARKLNAELIISRHDYKCTNCFKNGSCSLQDVARDLNITDEQFERKITKNKWDKNLPFFKNDKRCIKCMRCINVCNKIQSMGVWDVKGTGGRAHVGLNTADIRESNCTICGQCVLYCPVGALYERNDTERVFDAIAAKGAKTAVQISPAVKTSWGEPFGLTREEATEGKLVTALKSVGFDYVFNTNFAADINITEDAKEFAGKVESGGALPHLTSNCPSFVKFVKSEFPEFIGNLSTAKSSQQIMGRVIREYFGSDEKLYSVSVTPCISKKYECALDPGNVDASITTREIVKMIKESCINTKKLTEKEFDSPFRQVSGASALYGASGGTAEAVLRSAFYFLTGENPEPDAFSVLRGDEGYRVAEFDFDGRKIKVAVVSGLANARSLLEDIKRNRESYDYIEVMACPGGCSGGGGQPIYDDCAVASERTEYMYKADSDSDIPFAHDNPEASKLYEDLFSDSKADLLHTDHITSILPRQN